MIEWRQSVVTIGLMLFVTLAQAGAGTNLLQNPGFEESVTINTVAATGNYLVLLQRAVDIEQSEALAMPVGWGPNSGDGWLIGTASALRYVTGKPGDAVYAGTRALWLTSRGHAAVGAGGLKVRAEKLPGESTLVVGRPNRFSVWAKGAGRLMVYAYTYDVRSGTNIYGVTKVTPGDFVLTPTWTKYEGTIEFTSPEVGLAVFVIAVVGGQVTVDDAAFSGE